MKTLALIALLLTCANIGRAAHYSNKFFGIELELPDGWQSMDENKALQNMKAYEFNAGQAAALLRKNAGTVYLLTMMKYDPATYHGLIPTIKVRARQTSATSPEQARNELKAGLEQGLKTLPGYQYEQPWTQTELHGHKAITATVRYDIPVEGKSLPVRSCTYSVLRSGYILSITVSGAADKETLRICEAMKQSIIIQDPKPATRR